MGSNIGRTVRDNPIPLALIGAGLAWLMVSSRRGGDDHFDEDYDDGSGAFLDDPAAVGGYPPAGGITEEHELDSRLTAAVAAVDRRPDETEEGHRGRLDEARGRVLDIQRHVGETAEGFAQRVNTAIAFARQRLAERRRQLRETSHLVRARGGRRAREARHWAGAQARSARGWLDDSQRRARTWTDSTYRSVSEGAEAGAERARHLAEDAGGYLGRTAGAVSGGARYAWDETTEGLQHGVGRTVDFYYEQPLLAGAFGVALGVVLGLMLPRSRYEDEVLGGYGAMVRQRARSAVGEAADAAGRVVDEVWKAGGEAARREGLSPDEIREGMRDATAQARHLAADYAQRGRRVADEALEAGRRSVEEATGAAGDQPGEGPARAG